MKNKIIIGTIIITLLLISGIFLAYRSDFNTTNQKTTMNVSSQGPFKLSELIGDIQKEEYFKGYDNETLKWMESLGEKYVFSSSDAYIIMDKNDADKIPSVFATDVSINEIFSCEIIEKHSLGDIKYKKDVILVKNVDYIKEEINYYDV